MILLGGWLGWTGQSPSDGKAVMKFEERLGAALADRYRIEREIGSGGGLSRLRRFHERLTAAYLLFPYKGHSGRS